MQRLGMTWKVTTPYTKEHSEYADVNDALSSEEETELYRSLTMGIGYISHGSDTAF